MIYSEDFPTKNKSNITVSLSNFSKGINSEIIESLLPLNYAVNSYNFDFNSGALKKGLGIKRLSVPLEDGSTKLLVPPSSETSFKGVWHFRRYDAPTDIFEPLLMLYGDNHKVYVNLLSSNMTQFADTTIEFSDVPNAINYKLNGNDNIIMCNGNPDDSMVSWAGDSINYVSYPDAPLVTSCALHAGRLFATTGGDMSRLLFSDDLNPTNWTQNNFEGGYIEMNDERGALKKVIEFNNYLYVIREFGITRVSGWGEQQDFIVKHLYLSTARMYHNTAVLCGAQIIMLCADGLYSFNGLTNSKIDLGLSKFLKNVDNKNAVSAYCDGKYYLACRCDYQDNQTIGCEAYSQGYTNNTLIEYDLFTGNYNVMRGVDINYIAPLITAKYSKLVVCFNGEYSAVLGEVVRDGECFGVPTVKSWTSPMTDMGEPTNKKALKSLTLNTKHNIQIIINADGKEYAFDAAGSNLPVKVMLNITALKFSLTLKSNVAESEISDPRLQVAII